LDRFESLMGYEDGALLKDRKGKRIFQLRLEWQGKPLVFYLKRHRLALSWYERLQVAMGQRLRTEGRREWEHILAFHTHRLPTMTPVAMGERIVGGRMQESFVMTVGLVEYESLELVAPKRYAAPLAREIVQEKRMLIRAIGELTGQMHWCGFYHRDYYWTHIMLRWVAAEVAELRLIDLQRVKVHPLLARRWRVKDLASLNYSVSKLGLTRSDRLRFLKAYGVVSVRNWLLMEAVRRKTERIARHDRRRTAQ
jgi:heptose I phosphotransferase